MSMLDKTIHLDLPRRIAAYYLLLVLAAIVGLLAGLVLAAGGALSSEVQSRCVAQLDRAALAIERALPTADDDLQQLVGRWRRLGGFEYCAVVDPDGRVLAHSSPQRVGQHAGQVGDVVQQVGTAQRVHLDEDAARRYVSYQTPLRSGEDSLGMLRVAVKAPTLLAVVAAAADWAPWLILVPLGVLVTGAYLMRKTVLPLADIEHQLRELAETPSADTMLLRPVGSRGPANRGWNRLVESFTRTKSQQGLHDRLGEALGGFRRRKTDQILNSIPDGVAVTDEHGKITFTNLPLAAMLDGGTDATALDGRPIEPMFFPAGTDGVDHPLLDGEQRERIVVTEIARPGETGEHWRVARYPLRSADGKATDSHVWLVRDVTQHKLAEQMRGQFVNSATHELRTPLANIKAYAETLALSEMLEIEKQKEFCNTINSEATRLARLIDDLLSISSMEVGSLSLARQETDVKRLLMETIAKVRPQMEQKRIELETIIPDKLPELNLDKDKITLTLVNLLGNAAKYTDDGGNVILKVEVADELLIHVEDTGYGIAPEELSKVFDKFFRSDDDRVRDETGSGLGLSLAQEVARLHGGRITVESELNKGTTFTLALPLS